MENARRVVKLIINGEWSFKTDGRTFIRKDLAIKARANIILQNLTNFLRLPYTMAIPYSLAVEPASICNLRCSTCPAGLKRAMRTPAMLSLEDFKKTIDQIGDYLTHIQLWGWGEPFMNKDIYQMIAYAKKKGIIIVSSTNCHYLENQQDLMDLVHSGLDELILAVDGTTQEVFEKYRQGGSLEKVLQGIKQLVAIKKQEGAETPYLHLRMVINPYNESQKDDFTQLARDLGVDCVSFKKIDTGMGGVEGDNQLLPKNKNYIINLANGNYRYRCVAFWNFPVLSSNGNIALCSLDSRRETDITNINQVTNFRKVWNAAKARECRSKIKNDSNYYHFCKECACREPDFKNAYFDLTKLNGGGRG